MRPQRAAASRRPAVFWVDIGVKVVFVGLLALGAFSDLPQFEDKAFGWRLALYPLAALIVPAGWRLFARSSPYPYRLDLLFVLPFFVDVLGNTFDLYDTIAWWDDANHVVNWCLLTLAFGELLILLGRTRLEVFGYSLGFGAVTAILWELGEYLAFLRDSPEIETAYTDTLGDLLLGGVVGAGIAAILSATALYRERRDGSRQASRGRRA